MHIYLYEFVYYFVMQQSHHHGSSRFYPRFTNRDEPGVDQDERLSLIWSLMTRDQLGRTLNNLG